MKIAAAPPVTVVRPDAAGPAPASATMPAELRDYCEELEQWALANQKDARNDSIRFWMLKAPAVLSSALAGILAFRHWDTTAACLAALASACVLIDAVNPGGQLRNSHLGALHELRELEAKVVNDWRIGELSGRPHDSLAASILTAAQKIRDRIAKDLKIAETSFNRNSQAKR